MLGVFTMKFSAAFVVAALPYLLPLASAEEEAAADAASIARPQFTVSHGKSLVNLIDPAARPLTRFPPNSLPP